MSTGLPMPQRLWAIFAISFGNALVVLDGSVVNLALPSLARDLEVDSASVVLVVTTYQLIMVMALLPFANLGDRIGHRRLYQAGLLIFTVSAFLSFFAQSLPFLLIVRAAQALGAAASLSVSSALIRSIYPPDQLGRGLAVNSVVVSCSAALAPTLGGLVLTFASWRWIFATAVPFAFLSLAFARFLPGTPGHDKPFDVPGAVLCAATFGLLFFGLESAVHGDSPVVSAAIAAIGLGIGFLFVRRELGEARPILPVDLLVQPTLGLSAAAGFFGYMGTMVFMLSLPFLLQQTYHFTPAEVGAVLTPWPLMFAVISPLAGSLSDRIPAGLLGSFGMVMAAVGLVLLAFLPADPGYLDIIWRISLVGIGFGFFFSPNARLVIGSAPLHRTSAAGALTSMIRSIGQTAGATMLSALLAMNLGTGAVPILAAAALTLLGAGFSAARLRPALRNPRPEELEDI